MEWNKSTFEIYLGGSPGGYTLGACSGFDSRASHKSACD
jgi:hypothetical protein